MYCPECGKPNDDNALFCYDCGTALQNQIVEQTDENTNPTYETPDATYTGYGDEQKYQPVENSGYGYGYGGNQNYSSDEQNDGATTVPKAPMSKKAKIILGTVGGVFALLIVGIAVLTTMFTPEKTAENYFKALTQGDYSKMYSYIIDDEKKFVTETEFVEYMEANNYILPDSVSDFKCGEAIAGGFYTGSVGSSSSETYECYINYNVNDEFAQRQYDVNIVKVGGVIPTYKVSIVDILIDNVTVRAVKGATVTIDSKQLTIQDNTDDYSSETYDTFVANVLLTGTHTLRIEHEMYDTIEYEIYVNSYEKSFHYTSMDLKEETRTQIFNLSTETFKSMCSAAMSSKDFGSVTGKITTDTDDYQELVYDYNNFKNRIKNDDGVGYSSLNFTSFTDATSDFKINDNRYTCKVSYTYDNVYVYKDYRSSTGYSQRTTTDAEGYIYMTYELIDGEWQLAVIRDYKI